MITDLVRAVPRSVVSGYLRVARLPLTAVERVARQQNNEAWPPALAFEGLEANVETLAGSLFRDVSLTETGQLRQAKVAKLREAADLRTNATVERVQAREIEQERKAEIADQRKKSVSSTQKRKTVIEQEAATEKRAVDTAAEEKKAAAQAKKAAQDKVIERRDRATRSEALKAEAEALELAERAIATEEKADVIDANIEAAKAARKIG